MGKSKLNQGRRSLMRLLEYMLARRPDEFGLVPDEGWYSLKDVLKALQEEGRPCRQSQITELNHLALAEGRPAPVEVDDKRLRLTTESPPEPEHVAEPPKLLYGFCRRRAYTQVTEKGLEPSRGDSIVLAANEDMAERLGRRRDGQPVIITVDALKAVQSGIMFYRLGEEIYLCEGLPADLLNLPPMPKTRPENEKAGKPKKAAPSEGLPFMPDEDSMPGGFILPPEPRPSGESRKRRPKKEWQKGRRKERRRKGNQF